MLDNLIKRYKDDDVEEVVYKLTYAGKYIIIKGRTLAGSLIIISNTFKQYRADSNRFKGHLYKHLYDHYKKRKKGRFRVKVIAYIGPDTDHYQLLKAEQMELDAGRYNSCCLNNVLEAYIPLYDETTATYGWLPRPSVMNFKRWLSSPERKAHAKQYKK